MIPMVGIRSIPLALLTLALLPASAAATPTTQIIVKREPGLTGAERADIRADADVRFVDDLPPAADRGGRRPAWRRRDALRDLQRRPRRRLRRARPPAVMRSPTRSCPRLWALTEHRPMPSWASCKDVDDADSDVVEAWDSHASGRRSDRRRRRLAASTPTIPISSIRSACSRTSSGRRSDADDGNGHGTHVSGTIAATRDNGDGIAGVAPNAEVMALRVLDERAPGYDSDIAEAFVLRRRERRPRRECVSSADPQAARRLRAAIAAYPNTLFVVAAGNGGADEQWATTTTPGARSTRATSPAQRPVRRGFRRTQDARGLLELRRASPSTSSPRAGHRLDHCSARAPTGTRSATARRWPLRTWRRLRRSCFRPSRTLSAGDVKDILLASADAGNAFSGRSLSGGRLNVRAAVELAQVGTSLPDGDGDGFPDAADACATVGSEHFGRRLPRCGRRRRRRQRRQLPVRLQPRTADADGDGPATPATRADAATTTTVTASRRWMTPARRSMGHWPTAARLRRRPPPSDARRRQPDRRGRRVPDEYAISKRTAARSRRSPRCRRRVKKRSATVTVSTSRAATVKILVQRKKGRSWVRVTSKSLATVGNRATPDREAVEALERTGSKSRSRAVAGRGRLGRRASACGRHPRVTTCRLGVLALGDSITNGGGELQWGVALQSWALWVARGLGLPYTPHAVDGANVTDVLATQVPAVTGERYDLGCLYIGVNDVRALDWDRGAFERGHRAALELPERPLRPCADRHRAARPRAAASRRPRSTR